MCNNVAVWDQSQVWSPVSSQQPPSKNNRSQPPAIGQSYSHIRIRLKTIDQICREEEYENDDPLFLTLGQER